MERENQRKYPIFEQLSTEELEKLLAQDFTATDGGEPDVDYIMAIMGVINEREKAAGHQSDVDAAWKEFQEEYQGQAAAFERTSSCEAESSDHHQTSTTQVTRKHTRVFRYVIVAAILVVLLGGTASGFNQVFQAVVNWSAETFGFESPYGENSGETADQEDPYIYLRNAVAEYTDLPVVPKWAPVGTSEAINSDVQKTIRKGAVTLSGMYGTSDGEFLVRIQVHNENPPQYVISYQWDESEHIKTIAVNGLDHDIVCNYDKNMAVWTTENVECMIQGDLSVEDLEKMIDSIYEE